MKICIFFIFYIEVFCFSVAMVFFGKFLIPAFFYPRRTLKLGWEMKSWLKSSFSSHKGAGAVKSGMGGLLFMKSWVGSWVFRPDFFALRFGVCPFAQNNISNVTNPFSRCLYRFHNANGGELGQGNDEGRAARGSHAKSYVEETRGGGQRGIENWKKIDFVKFLKVVCVKLGKEESAFRTALQTYSLSLSPIISLQSFTETTL